MLDTTIAINEQTHWLVDRVMDLPRLDCSFELMEAAYRNELMTLQQMNDQLKEQAVSLQSRSRLLNAYVNRVSHSLAHCQRSSLKMLQLVQEGAAD